MKKSTLIESLFICHLNGLIFFRGGNSILLLLCTSFVLSSCDKAMNPLESALQLAGANRMELEKVLQHYSTTPDDSLKYRSAVYLIENMPEHYSYSNATLLNRYYDQIDSVLQIYPNDSAAQTIVLIDLLNQMSVENLLPVFDNKIISSAYLIKNIDQAMNLWMKGEWASHLNFDEFCEYLLPYKAFEGQVFDDWRVYLKTDFGQGLSILPYCDLYKNSAYQACLTINDTLRNRLHPLITSKNPLTISRLSTLSRMPVGTCSDYCNLATAVMRAQGIPVGVDFTPQWPFRDGGHSWNVLLENTGKTLVFESGGPAPGSPHKKVERMAKVFRETYAANHDLKLLISAEGSRTPPSIRNLQFAKDVTGEYMETQDITIEIPPSVAIGHRYAYLAVYNNRDWVPIAWGKLSGSKVVFRDMGKNNIIYLPIYFTDNGIEPIAAPFIITQRGMMKSIECDTTKRQTLIIRRKYPVFQQVVDVSTRVIGGQFQASNNADFKSFTTLHIIPESGVLASEIDLSALSDKYRYWRFYSAPGGYCNMAELYFIDKDLTLPLTGRVIGTLGSYIPNGLNNREAAFDRNPLTHFDAPTPGDGWVGMDFGHPVQIDSIAYVPRGDGNDIEIGDRYELFYWNDGWISLGKQTANRIHLTYNNCPSNALFFLHDETKGVEERIFMYENGSQLFW